jgi:hypothetical protein
MEIWKTINGFENYKVSNLGKVLSYQKNKKELILKERITKHGYCRVMLQKGIIKKECFIHRLVADAFIENKENKEQINHLDLNKSNNRVENLEWCTRSENMIHSLLNGRNKKYKKIVRYNLSEEKIYHSIKIASQENNISTSSIHQCLKGKSKTSNGYKWKYYYD